METLTAARDRGGPAAFIPPMPPLAPDRVGALGVLAGLRRNAYAAFPPRCRAQGVVVMPPPGRDVVIAAGPQAMRDVLVLARLLRDNDLVLDDDAPVLPVGSFATRPSRSPTFRLQPCA
ncbi:hypothetical protein [Methylobacterium sp. GC_Met_2]|uniref:hypothetical protein n=1 Tax=Methylobacterium sp. GC_Met_2 TaxID=2937376 RepID=UPI00226B2642|nr:hypothetical protein [Methylobacterium sp. GC_Met_2]